MKRKHILPIFILTFSLGACVDNPNVTEDIYLDTPSPSKSWVNGLRRQLALTMNSVLINTEMVSDNYFNNYTQYSKVFDGPVITYIDLDVNSLQREIGRLREMADYGLEVVVPQDSDVSNENVSYMHFCRGMAMLLAGENFTGLPIEPLAEVSPWRTLLAIALDEFDLAIGLAADPGSIAAYQILKARTHYRLGDLGNAQALANSLMGGTPQLYTVGYDGENGVSNEMQNATFSSDQNRFAPLPRLDFLDPKYYDLGTAASDQKPVNLAKSEEAYLIVMEALLAGNDLAVAKQVGLDLLEVVQARPKVSVDDSRELRNGTNRFDYPTTSVQIREDEGADYKEGYVLDRQAGEIWVHTVSGTKVTQEDILGATSVDRLLYLVYRLRQEIFISEGRRMNDLGIRFPVSQTEQLNNPKVDDAFTQTVIPPFIPLEGGLDDFTVDGGTGNITMVFDMNQIIVDNKTSEHVAPFH